MNVGSTALNQSATIVEVRPGLTRAGEFAASLLSLPRDSVRTSPSLPDDLDVRITLGQR